MQDSFGEVLQAFRKQQKMSQQHLARHLGVHLNTISGWERGNHLPDSKSVVLELARHLHLDDQQTRRLLEASLTALSPYWQVPYQRNPFFTGRVSILHQLHAALRHDHTTLLSQSYTLSGLGGIGKTQTAIEYAYRYANDYSAVFWISAETLESLVSSLVLIARVLDLPEKQEHEQERVVTAVTRWLSTHRDWLVIFDNVEEVEWVKGFLSSARCGSFLLTSRKQALGFIAQILTLEQMTQEEGMCLLLHRARLCDLTVSQDSLTTTENVLAQEIVAAMDGLPLALDQAGAYIEATQCSLSDYLQLFQASHLRLLDMREAHADHPLSVTRTFALAFERLEQTCPPAAELLTACAFLAPEAIPETFFREGATHLGPTFEALAADPLQFQEIMKVLLSYSLLQRQTTTQTVTIHRLVQTVLKGRLPKGVQRTWVTRVISAMIQLFPSDMRTQANYWQVWERLLPHALMGIALSDQLSEDEILRTTLMSHVATYLSLRARYTEAESLFQRALHIGEQVLGSEHLLIANILHRLAVLYRRQGRYEEAEPLFLRALRIREQTLGVENSLVAETLSHLSVLYAQQGKYEEAEFLAQRAVRILSQVVGQEHPEVASAFYRLGTLYAQQGKYEEAESLFQQAAHIWEQVAGAEHSEVAYPLNGLANIYMEQGKDKEAESLFQRVMHIWEQALGPEHPEMAYPLYNLADLYIAQNKYREAQPLFQRALTIWEQTFGSEHYLLTYPLTGLAEIAREDRMYEEAEPLFQRAIHIWERSPGTVNADVADPLTGLATLYSEQGMYREAEPLFQRALAIRKQHLGPQHPYVAATLHHFARFHQVQQQTAEALSLYQQALAIREQALGSEHPKTCATRMAYTQLLSELEREDDVEPYVSKHS